jgi:hypothetical protein
MVSSYDPNQAITQELETYTETTNLSWRYLPFT